MENGQNNKNKIIEYATKLFYENGYNNTSFESIATYCEITKPLITYHFGTKANLAKEVVKKYSIDIKNTISSKIYFAYKKYNLKHSTVVEILALTKLNNEDEKVKRFLIEYVNSGFENLFVPTLTYFYKAHDRHYNLDIDKESDEINMLSTASNFASLSLNYAYFTGKLDCNYEQFTEYTVRIPFRFMNIDNKEIDEIIREGNRIFNELDIKVCPYFKIK